MKNLLPPTDICYNALLKSDSGFEGIFVVGVRTTGIFCRPTCTARKPKKQNVEFFGSCREAMLSGYRPCKVCNPLGHEGENPSWLTPLLDEIQRRPEAGFSDRDLRERGMEPNRVRRWFKKHHGMTFQTYVRTLKISRGFERIKNGEKVIDAAFESGYESLSGFADTFKKTTGLSPTESHKGQLVKVTRILTPLGPMLAGATDEGICFLEFIDRRMLQTQLKRLRKLLNAVLLLGANKHLEELSRQLKEYFDGSRIDFDLPLVLPGTPFQQSVWAVLRKIPYGSTRSYKQQAELLGNPTAVRAVARANGDNRIAIVIPCHRVIGAQGELVGYGGGVWRKQYLLNLERGRSAVSLGKSEIGSDRR
jgi:AraC family transcriptional regulator of adaptative response/methylated-DNA-[protein]-cysteine methyltransferase